MKRRELVPKNVDVATPEDLYAALNAKYNFDHDPCPLQGVEERTIPTAPWGQRNYVNPPFRDSKRFLRRAIQELAEGKLSVFLMPSNTDTNYWNAYVFPYATSIQFINSRVVFQGYGKPFPAPLVVVEFDPEKVAEYKIETFARYRFAGVKRKFSFSS
jgi:uncharacterized protein (DUF2126 family)